ncbi:MAG: NPCBM/NEW2 domain-containing protein [Deinococcus sp.]
MTNHAPPPSSSPRDPHSPARRGKLRLFPLPALLVLGLFSCRELASGGLSGPAPASDDPGVNHYAGNPDVGRVGFSYDGADQSWSDPGALGDADASPAAPGSGSVPLSALPWASADNGWGPPERDQSNGELLSGDGAALTLNGKVFPSGLGVHAPSRLVYAPGGSCGRFRALVGLDDEVRSLGTVSFQVWADGVRLWDSGRMTGLSPAASVDLNVAGRKEVQLVVTDGGDGNLYDHADWAGATLDGCGGQNAAVTPASIPSNPAPPGTTPGGPGVKVSAPGKAAAQPASASVRVPDTNYPVPGDALVVSPSGSDGAAGSVAAPLRTLSRALALARERPGVTIVMRGGNYRESPGTFSSRVTIQPYPHEQVWMKGSTVVSGWRPDGKTWVRDNWSSSLCQTCFPRLSVNASAPLAGSPDMVFVDGQQLRQVGTRRAVRADSFYLDPGAKQLVIGTNPGNRVLEAAVSPQALVPIANASGSVIRGIGFAQYGSYASPGSNMAMVSLNTPGIILENDVFLNSASRGLAINESSGTSVRRTLFLNNGLLGLSVWRSNGLRLEDSVFLNNNRENFVRGSDTAEASGAKIVSSRDVTVRGSIFRNNRGSGLWFDIACQHLLVRNNTLQDNASNGVSLELCNDAVVFSNLIVNNGGAGLSVSNTNAVQIYNNTFVNNGTNLSVTDDNRVSSDFSQIRQGMSWVTGDVHFVNNISAGVRDPSQAQVMVRDFNSVPLKSADEMLSESNFNAYLRVNPSERYLVEWWKNASGRERYFQDLNEYRSSTGREGRSLFFEGAKYRGAEGNPFFVDPAGDYRLKAGSPALNAGTSLPAALGTRLELDGSRMSLGALSWPR